MGTRSPDAGRSPKTGPTTRPTSTSSTAESTPNACGLRRSSQRPRRVLEMVTSSRAFVEAAADLRARELGSSSRTGPRRRPTPSPPTSLLLAGRPSRPSSTPSTRRPLTPSSTTWSRAGGRGGGDGPEATGSTIRHTFATFALRAGISTFDLSRCMDASLTMIDRYFVHFARDGREHAIRLLDELSAGERPRWTLVDAAWTPESAPAASRDNGTTG